VAAPQGGCKGTLRRVSSAGETLWERPASFPAKIDLPPAETPTRLELSCAGFWSAPLELPAGVSGDGFATAVFPGGSIRGRIVLPDSAPRPAGLAVRLRPPPGAGPTRLLLLSPCTLQNASFFCPLPAGKLDLSLVADGFAPAYLWGVEVKSGGDHDVGPVRLAAGASIAGWVIVPSPSQEAVTAEVAPETTGWLGDPAASKQMSLRAARASTDARGFFQLTGLAAGTYRLVAARSDLAPVDLPVELEEGKELVLSEPVRLSPPVTLEAFVHPPEADGQPLSGILEREVPRTNVFEQVTRRPVGPDGSWTAARSRGPAVSMVDPAAPVGTAGGIRL
jgi:hypothetical protein